MHRATACTKCKREHRDLARLGASRAPRRTVNAKVPRCRHAMPGVGTLTLLLVLATAFLAGCKGGASITVDATVPSPLVDPIPASLGVYFDDTLVSYVHEEDVPDYGPYRIDIGASQAPVFARVFDAMFKNTVQVARADRDASPVAPAAPADTDQDDADEDEVDDPILFVGSDGSSLRVDGIIAPTIEEVQFAIPDQTGGDFYEVWIRYKLTLFDGGGNNLGELPLIGYGKANERNFGQLGKQTPALHQATTWALRDAAAVLSFQFRDQAQVKNWLTAIGAETQDQGTPQ